MLHLISISLYVMPCVRADASYQSSCAQAASAGDSERSLLE